MKFLNILLLFIVMNCNFYAANFNSNIKSDSTSNKVIEMIILYRHEFLILAENIEIYEPKFEIISKDIENLISNYKMTDICFDDVFFVEFKKIFDKVIDKNDERIWQKMFNFCKTYNLFSSLFELQYFDINWFFIKVLEIEQFKWIVENNINSEVLKRGLSSSMSWELEIKIIKEISELTIDEQLKLFSKIFFKYDEEFKSE